MRFHIETLGCAKNSVDSASMARRLISAGYQPAATREQADVVIVNTCGFIDLARAESLATLRDYAAAKRDGQVLVAAGCFVQLAGRELQRALPEVDAFLGTRSLDQIDTVIARMRGAGIRPGPTGTPLLLDVEPAAPHQQRYPVPSPLLQIDGLAPETTQPTPTAPPRRSAFLKIADGCEAPCSFCVIPTIKGGYGSKPIETLVAEARALAAEGVREINLIAQDTTAYGYDWGEKEAFARLLERLTDEVPEIVWWRVLYAYPGHLTERAVAVMASRPAIVHYVDMPLQHAHPAVLRRMRRPSLEIARRNIAWLRQAMPDIALRTTFIVGFPGETEEEFRFLLDFMREVEFDRVGIFQYSPEPGTPAARLPDPVPEAVKAERYHRAMQLQQQISLRRNRAQVGRRLTVLIEGEAKPPRRRRRPLWVGRSYRDAPEVDGLVFCEGPAHLGDLVQVQITQALPYDLQGTICA